MRFNDHHFPHFHAAYAEHDISIAITTLEVLKGRLPEHKCKGDGMGAEQSKRAVENLDGDPPRLRCAALPGSRRRSPTIGGIKQWLSATFHLPPDSTR